ncbi:MAG TPA: hypothetical protein VFF40_05215, partial [Acidimicrobiia bacterium]|nr:hypothetical protein [Acidimicrobiia bacterium]
PHELSTARGKDTGIDVDRIVLSSAAGGEAVSVAELTGASSEPAISSTEPATRTDPGVPEIRVTSSGRDRVTARVAGAESPFWMVLGQSQNAGWRAELEGTDGTVDLGGSTLVDGYANGWLVRPPPGGGPFTIRMRWAPQRVVNAALAVSAVAIVVALAIAVVTGVRSRRRRRNTAAPGGVIVSGLIVSGAVVSGAVVGGPEGRAKAALEDLAPSPGAPPVPEGSGWAPAIGLGVFGAVVAGLLLQPWAGLVVGPAALVAVRVRRARPALALFPAVAVAACGLYIAVQQHRHRFAPKFEWPTFFGRVNQLAWLAVLVLAVGAAAEIVARRRSQRS